MVPVVGLDHAAAWPPRGSGLPPAAHSVPLGFESLLICTKQKRDPKALSFVWCRWSDSNRHGSPHLILSQARLPFHHTGANHYFTLFRKKCKPFLFPAHRRALVFFLFFILTPGQAFGNQGDQSDGPGHGYQQIQSQSTADAQSGLHQDAGGGGRPGANAR